MMYTITTRRFRVPSQYWTETCFTLNNGMKCNWDFFDMPHKLGFIGR